MSIKKYILIVAVALSWACQEGLSQDWKRITQVELVGGAGFRFGQVASVTPQIAFLVDYGNGLSVGPGIGIRGGIITAEYQIPDKIRHTQEEIDLTLFYRFRYAWDVFFMTLDAGGVLGLYSHYGRPNSPKCRYSGLFIEPHAGARFGRLSFSLGVLLNPSDYRLTEVKGDMLAYTFVENALTPALTLHVGYAL